MVWDCMWKCRVDEAVLNRKLAPLGPFPVKNEIRITIEIKIQSGAWLGRVMILWLLLTTSRVLAADDFEFFEKRIRPVLVERCHKCHSAQSEKLKGGLRLDSRAMA